ncbi:deoxyribodipyrimidine photo-lyase [Roseovarius azorensis]|uniref:Deoxyribodipyrimidine photo-lyase n=1 Tax=Roseovarius azorensis TaxID=1287727 RepID=A0A1H7HVR0_9RHOB|nr:deoxyribodipyrimidine photo-lyase [Roseovarius azorensis]SEK54361.1 deoxyribodipyrimidine photo-lyase [Roseovarius azorensis]
MTDNRPSIVWLRRDLRLADHPALDAAVAAGGPVIPVFIHDESVATLGAAPEWRLGLSIDALGHALEEIGSRLILRRGAALEVLRALVAETGAGAVHWSRLYDPAAIARDKAVKSALRKDGIAAHSHAGHVMFEPWAVETGTGGFYRVYSPMWRAVKDREVPTPLGAPARIPAPETWPASDVLDDWRMGIAMRRGANVCLPHQRVGEAAAMERLHTFTTGAIADYREARNFPALDATSTLSENLTYGEISPRQCWQAGQRALLEGARGAEHWLKELVWREFAYHLMYHTPEILTRNWRRDWDGFGWSGDATRPEVIAWKQGCTGVRLVDAAMREMYVTGKMHNRARMIVASYLTKHLMTDWRVGLDWFADCLTDWDPASNAMGWQWVAGCGPDAAPYFRIFNPETQLEKFDPEGVYANRWIAEGQARPGPLALAYFDAVPHSWALDPKSPYPAPVVDLAEGRQAALAAYEARNF